MKTWQIQTTDGIDGLEQARLDLPDPGPGEVRVRLRANAINYRDLSVIGDPAGRNIALPRIPNSDGAGDVLAVGAGVTEFAVGDRVASCFFQNWTDGPCTAEAMASALGRSEEHTSETQSLMRKPYAVLCLPKKTLK